MKKHRTKYNPVKIIILLILVLVVFYSGFQIFKTVNTQPQQEIEIETETVSKTISRDGINYYPRQDITVVMLLGIDQAGKVKSSESYNNEGEADMISLVVFDETDKSYSVVMVNRDTMMDVPVLGIKGKQAGTSYQQVALSHTYGDGLVESCENTQKAISNFFYGLNIDYYVSVNMDAISILTDAVGGVKVNVTDDFSEINNSIPMGETVLNGEQALTFVQTRKNLGDQLNVSRMVRHEAFMKGFMEALNESAEKSDGFIIKTYKAVEEYMVTDCSATTMNTIANRYSDYQLKEVISPEGKNTKGETYMEFYADEDELDKLILRMFYAKK